MMVLVGVGMIAFGIAYLVIKLRVVYWVARDPGSAGGVPTLDTLVVPPASITIAVVFALDGLPVRIGMAIWAGSVIAALICMWLATHLGLNRGSS
jgi:hypothetical protein